MIKATENRREAKMVGQHNEDLRTDGYER